MANGGDFIQMMADKPQKRPSKGILKTSTSFEKPEKTTKKSKAKATKWDEMNIIATLHPADKDYGHMKIEEPKTPYAWDVEDEDDVDGQTRHVLDPSELAEKLKGNLDRSPRRDAFERESEDSDADLTAEELARRKVFKSKRKMHYNEFKVVEFARKLIKADEEALDNDECDTKPTSSSNSRIDEERKCNSEEESNTLSESKVEDIRLHDSDDSSLQLMRETSSCKRECVKKCDKKSKQ